MTAIHFSDTAKSEKSSDPVVEDDGEGEEANKTSNITLTGNPQIDYIHDPNLPFQLNGYNLSDYPFYHRVPKNINFSCDGRKDGFYASVEHKCQVNLKQDVIQGLIKAKYEQNLLSLRFFGI